MADEKVDIDEARQREILALEARLTSSNHFEVLGLQNGASIEQARTAFRELSLRFHPDRFFGRNMGPFKAKLDRIFRRLIEANQTLGDADRRAAWLAANPHLQGSGGSAIRSGGEKTETERARDEERRRRFALHPYLSKATRVVDTIHRAREHLKNGEFSQAFSILNQASSVEPGNQELKVLLAEARRKLEHGRAAEQFKRGQDALDMGDDDGALSAFRSAVSADPTHHPSAYKVALLLQRRGAHVHEVLSYAQKAVQHAPAPTTAEAAEQGTGYHRLLSKLYESAGSRALSRKHHEESERLGREVERLRKKR